MLTLSLLQSKKYIMFLFQIPSKLFFFVKFVKEIEDKSPLSHQIQWP